jgi:hypothetical protein
MVRRGGPLKRIAEPLFDDEGVAWADPEMFKMDGMLPWVADLNVSVHPDHRVGAGFPATIPA